MRAEMKSRGGYTKGEFRLLRALAPLATAAAILAGAGGSTAAPPCGTPPCGGGGGKPITISLAQNLEFGSLAGDATSPGTAIIDPASGAKSVTGGVADFGGINTAASFDITGDKNVPFTIILPGTVTLTSGGNTMSLGTFTSSPAAASLLDNTGKATIGVGGTLQVGVSQAAGAYTGVFTVTVNY